MTYPKANFESCQSPRYGLVKNLGRGLIKSTNRHKKFPILLANDALKKQQKPIVNSKLHFFLEIIENTTLNFFFSRRIDRNKQVSRI